MTHPGSSDYLPGFRHEPSAMCLCLRRPMPIARLARSCVAALALTVIPPATVWVPDARCDEAIGVGEEISLEDRLRTGLRVRRPEDGEFIAEVVRRVNAGDLPRKLVDSTFIWAVRRQKKYPFPAFEQALRLQAERLGVDL